MDKYEQFVCSWFLSEYDHTLSYGDVKAQLLSGNGIVWQPFEDFDIEDLCDLMDFMRDSLITLGGVA